MSVATARTTWTRLGRIAAFLVTAAFFAIAIIAGLTLDNSTSPIVGAVLFCGLVAYCVARERQGWDLFGIIAAPNVLSMLAHDTFGTPRWLAVLLIPFVLWGAWRIDRHPAADTRISATSVSP